MPDETQSKPDPPKTIPSKEDTERFLSLLVTTAMNTPDRPQVLLATVKHQPIELIKSAILSGVPFPWHNSIEALVGGITEDETKLVACLFAVVFVQGAGMRQMMNNSNGSAK
jgi:hypothetical protein